MSIIVNPGIGFGTNTVPSVIEPNNGLIATLGSGPGNCTNGVHFIAVTYVTSSGETRFNQGDPPTNVTIVNNSINGKIHLTNIPLSPDKSVIARNIYITEANVDGAFQTTASRLVTNGVNPSTIMDNTTTTFDINIADADLGHYLFAGSTAGFNLSSQGVRALTITSVDDNDGVVPIVNFFGIIIQNGDGSTAGYIIPRNENGGFLNNPIAHLDMGFIINPIILGNGSISATNPAFYFTTNYIAGEGYINKKYAPQFVVDGVDFASQTGAFPTIFYTWSLEDGTTFAGGFSAAGGGAGFGITPALMGAVSEPNPKTAQVNIFGITQFPTLVLHKIVGAASQTGNLSEWRNSSGTLLARVSPIGSIISNIPGKGRFEAQTAAKTVITLTPTTDGSFLISANILVTTATVHSFSLTCTYTDEGNTARTLTLSYTLIAGGTLGTLITNTNGTVPYEFLTCRIRVKASTAISIQTVGTFTTVVYNVEADITQVN